MSARVSQKSRQAVDERNVLEAITETVREVVCRVDLPLRSCSVMWRVEHAIRDQIPHHRVARLEILFHSQNRLAGLIEPVLHLLELSKGLLDGSCPVDTSFPRSSFLAASVGEDLLRYAKVSVTVFVSETMHIPVQWQT